MITELKPNEIFVFGSNTQGRHGAGAAKLALNKFGAIYGQAEGLQGQSYGFITKNLTGGEPTINKAFLQSQALKLIECAKNNPTKTFLLTAVGCGLAGFPPRYMAQFFSTNLPSNIVLPVEFRDYV